MSNRHLERAGREERIDHRSNAARGIDEIPTIHEGVTAQALERKGIISDRCEINRQIKADNVLLRELKAEIKKLEAQEQKYSAEMDKALSEYAELKAQASDFDSVELYQARQVLRPAQEKAAERQLEETLQKKPSLIMLLSAKQEVSRLLGEDTEERQARQMIMRRRSTEQLKRSHLKTDRCKIER